MSEVSWNFISDLSLLKQKADVIIEADANTMYLGFCTSENPGTDAAKWAVCRIEASGSSYPVTTTIKWADGNFKRDKVMDDYATLTYKFRNFAK